jgi:hypothetical protein
MSIVAIIAWAVPILTGTSLAGYIALLVFAHPVAVIVEQAAFKLASAVISSRIGCAAATALVVGSACWWIGDDHGAERVQAEWDAAEHAAIEAGREAREEAEREIPPVPADPIAPAPVRTETFHMPRIFNPRPADACPPVPQCPPAAARAVPPELRHDAHNRDHR